jgi:hypothetical protein
MGGGGGDMQHQLLQHPLWSAPPKPAGGRGDSACQFRVAHVRSWSNNARLSATLEGQSVPDYWSA